MCVDLNDLHGEDGSHYAMCNSYHSSMGVVGSDMDASLVWLSSCDWRYIFLVYSMLDIISWFTLDASLEFGMICVLMRPRCMYVHMVHVIS